jgi:cobalt-zinc-cadmium efflux system protein
MGHDHGHHHDHQQSKGNIKVAIWLNTGFAILELIGGFYTNSVAILSDALHDFGDSLSLTLAYFFEKKSGQVRDDNFSYGYKRFSLIGAFVNSLVLVVGSVFIIREAIRRLAHPENADARGMLVLAILGIAVNTVAMLRLRKGSSINERVISLHFVEDILGWIAVLIGSIVMLFADVPALDPLLSMLIAGFILFNVYKNLRQAFRIILQGIPQNVDMNEVKQKISAMAGVIGIHDIHTWTMDGRYNIMTLHLVLKKETTLEQAESIKKEIRHLAEHQNIQHLTIETEMEGQACALEDC